LKEYLRSFAIVDQEIITTHVQTDTVEKMISALAFVWSDGDAKRTDAFLNSKSIAEYIETNCRTNSGFSFMFHHYLIDVHR
jgi:hypothetical protein